MFNKGKWESVKWEKHEYLFIHTHPIIILLINVITHVIRCYQCYQDVFDIQLHKI